MKNKYFKLQFLLGFLLCSCIFLNSQAATYFNISLVAPPDRVVYAPPAGFLNCYVVPAGIYNGIWLNTRRICAYNNGMWISGHWSCNNYIGGRCPNWGWRNGYWVYPRSAEYNYWWGRYRPMPYRPMPPPRPYYGPMPPPSGHHHHHWRY